MELLPAGSMLGSASLWVETKKRSLLYVPHLQTASLPNVAPMQLKKADTLILGTHHADLHSPPRTCEKKRLLDAILACPERVKIFCASIGTAQEIIAMLSVYDIKIAVHPTIATINRAYTSCAVELGKFSVLTPKLKKGKSKMVLLFPTPALNRARIRRLAGVSFLIHDVFPPPQHHLPSDAEFHLPRTCAGTELRTIVNKVRPQELFTFGDYAKIYRTELSSLCPKTKALFAGYQPTLF